MTVRVAAISTLLAAAFGVLGYLPAAHFGRIEAQEFRPERLAQLRRQTDEGGSPTEPGGLPGRSERPDDSRPMTRGFVKSQKKADPDKGTDKSKAEDRSKKDQR